MLPVSVAAVVVTGRAGPAKQGRPMSLIKCFDASGEIPSSTPDGCEACLGYIGGAAAHVWTLPEWKRFGHLIQFPIWVADFSGDPATQGSDAAKAATKLGWRGARAIVLDMETVNDPKFLSAWAAEIRKAKFTPAWYGSRVYSAQAAGYLRWLADPDGIASLQPGFDAVQYSWNVKVPGGVVDLSVVDSKFAAKGGRGPRR
jgi:hypothetical protein